MQRTRRTAIGIMVALAAVAALTGITTAAVSAASGPMGFDPIAGSAYGQPLDPAAPWVIPDGFNQYVVSDESDLDIYAGGPDLNDMSTVNETGRHAGRYLYRTHEVRGANNASNGSVSVVDIETGEAEILVQDLTWDALDGLVWTPWGTLLFAEETARGQLLEIRLDPRDPTEAAAVIDRPALGRMAHEGIEIGPDGSVYVIDELRGGAIYRFVPDRRGDLSSGVLYALRTDGPDGTGHGEWLPLDRAAVQVDATAEANRVGATDYRRPEDLELIGGVLYAAITEGGNPLGGAETYQGRVIAIDLSSFEVTDFVKPGVNVPVEIDGSVTGLDGPDNLADGPDGRLWIVEDNDNSDIWVAGDDHDGDGAADTVELFASLTDVDAEGTGIYFGKDSHTLFVNIQHSMTGRDSTWAITNRD